MTRIEALRARREEILKALASLDQIRRGSVVQQYVEQRRKDGSVGRRGPYPLYSFKEKRKTISRRLKSEEEVATYRDQIERFRRFRARVEELVRVGEQMSDLAAMDPTGQKKTPRSRSRRTRKSPGS